MPQERYNTDWVREKNAGIVLESFKLIRDGVEQVVSRLDEFRASTSQIRNRAVFEIPDILERIMSAAQSREYRTPGRDDARGAARLN